MKYLRVMDGNKSNASNYEYKIDEVNISSNWNPSTSDPKEMGGFNFSNEEAILRWTIRGTTLYDVIIPDDAEIIECKNKNTPGGVFRTNKIIVTNPRLIDEKLMVELYNKSKLPINTYFQCLSFLSLKDYSEVCKKIIIDKINEDNIETAYDVFTSFIEVENKEQYKLYSYIDSILLKLKEFYKSKKYFYNYIKNNYDINNEKINHKLNHTNNVILNSEKIALSLSLEPIDFGIALLVGLLHDIGRFSQAIKFKSFREDITNYDHALVGSILLFEEQEINNYQIDKEYYNIIKCAIENHSKYEVDYSTMNEKEILHTKIIRDADKLDSFRAKLEDDIFTMSNLTKEEIENSTISDKVYNEYISYKTILSSDRKSAIDIWLSYIAFVFDLNFDSSINIIKENNYINKMFDKYNYLDKEKMEYLKEITLKYLDK